MSDGPDDRLHDDGRGRASGRAGLAALVVVLAVMAAIGYRTVTAALAAREDAAILDAATGPGDAALEHGLATISALDPRERRVALLADDRLRAAAAARIDDGGVKAANELVRWLAAFDGEVAGDLLHAPAVRAAIVRAHRDAADAHFAPGSERFEYRPARRTLDALARILPGDPQAAELSRILDAARDEQRARLERAYRAHLDAGRFAPAGDAGSVAEVIDVLTRVDPAHALLEDPGRAQRMLEAAEMLLDDGDAQGALAVLSVRQRLAPGDALLDALARRALAEAAGLAAGDETETLRAALEARRDGLRRVEDYLPIADDLARLARLAPGDALVSDLRWQLETLLASRIEAALRERRVEQAAADLHALAPLVRLATLADLRERIASVAAALGTDPFAALATPAERRTLRREIEALMRRPTLEPGWNVAIAQAMARQVVLAGPRGRGVPAVVRALELLYADGARSALADGDDARAARLVAAGQGYAPGSSALARVESDLAARGVGYHGRAAVRPGTK